MVKRWSLILMVGIIQGGLCLAADSSATPQTLKLHGKPIQLAHYAKAFIGSGNVTVEVAPYKVGDESRAILLFHGIESPWDGKAVDHEVHDQGYGHTDYIATYKGHDFHTLLVRDGAGGQKRYELYVPDVLDGIQITPSDGAAQLTDPLKIFQQYLEQEQKKK